jgi:hypothetical protein
VGGEGMGEDDVRVLKTRSCKTSAGAYG